MNIGIFTDTYYPQISGVVTSIRTLEKELNKLGHKVFIFTTTDPDAASARLPRVFRLPSMPLVFEKSKRLAFFFPPKLLWKMRFLKLDVIHTQTEFSLGIFGKVVSKALRVPIVHTYHTMYEDYTHYVLRGHLITPSGARKYSRVFCNRADAVIAPAKKTKESLLDYGVIKPIEVVPTGIDFAPFTPGENSAAETAALKKSLGIAPNVPVAVYVGRLAKEKSLDVVLRGFKETLNDLPQAKLVIVGLGPIRAELERQAAELGMANSVIFTGAVEWQDVGKYYRLGDIFVTASTSETQGLTYAEAMASGTCLVAKRDRSTEDLLENGVTGFDFVEDNDAAGVMLRALKSKEERSRVVKNASERVQSLSAAAFAKKCEGIYKTAIDNNKGRREPRKNIINRSLAGIGRGFKRLIVSWRDE